MTLAMKSGALAAALALSALASPAQADPQWCTGNIATSWIETSGAVFISSYWRMNHTQICNVRQEWKGIPVDTCAAWVAKLDAAAAMNRQLTIFYHDAPACNSLPTYSDAPAPGYVMLING